jgi:hypothetical protein
MTDVKSAWKDAGERFAALGASLKAHYGEQRGSDEESTKQEMGEATKRFTGAIQDAVDALGAAAKDPAVKEDVRKVGTSLVSALSATFAEVSDDLRRIAERDTSRAEGTRDTGDGGAAGTAAEGTAAAQPEEAQSTVAEPGGTEGTDEPRVEPWGTP